jgi:hypothetical protein
MLLCDGFQSDQAHTHIPKRIMVLVAFHLVSCTLMWLW